MSVVGIQRVFLGLLDESGAPIIDADRGLGATGLIEITNEMLGTNSVNWQVSKDGEEVDGNNVEVDYIKGQPQSSMDIVFNDLPWDIKNKVLGRVKLDNGWVDSLVNSYVCVITESPTIDFKDMVYICQPKSVATSKGINMQSSTSKKVNRTTDEISFEGLTSDKANDMPVIYGSTKDAGFNVGQFFSQVFPGQTLKTGAGADTVVVGGSTGHTSSNTAGNAASGVKPDGAPTSTGTAGTSSSAPSTPLTGSQA